MTRPGNPGHRFMTLHVSRGIAALMVVFFHADLLCSAARLKPFGNVFAFGDSGVDFFFVLSGFIMTSVHFEEWGRPDCARKYVWRRFVRIYPTYWLATLLYSIPLLIIPWMRASNLSSPGTFALTNIFLLPSNSFLVIPPAWTLQHEILFYGLFLSLILNRYAGAMVFCVWTALIALAAALETRPGFPYNFLLNTVNLEFVIGMVCALVAGKTGFRTGLFLLFLGGLFFFGASIAHAKQWLPGMSPLGGPFMFTFIKGLSAGSLIVGLVTVDRSYHYQPDRILTLLGSASYSIYLMHLPSMVFFLLILIAIGLLEKLSAETVFAVLATYGILVGLVFYVLVEKPLLRWLRS